MFIGTLIVGLITVFFIVITLSTMEISRIVKQWNREYIVQRFGIVLYQSNDLIQSLKPKISSLFGYDEAAKKYRAVHNTTKK